MKHEDLGLFFDISLEMLCIAGTDGYFRHLNPIWTEVLGYSLEELKSRPFLELVHPDDVESTINEVARLSQGLKTVNFENRYLHKEGHWVVLSWKAATRDNGTIYAVARDITKEKDQLNLLEESERRLRSFLEALPIGIYILNADGDAYYANARSSELLGKGIVPNASVENLAEVYNVYYRGTDQPYPDEELPVVQALRGQTVHVEDIEIDRGDHRVPIEVWAEPVFDENGKVIYSIAGFTDISRRLHAREQLEQLLEDLAKSNKELDQFTYIVSHDLKAPLRAITSLSEWIEEDLGDRASSDIKKKLDLLRERTRLMQNLINDLLQYARIGREKRPQERFSLMETIESVEGAIIKPPEFQIIVPKPLPEVLADKTQMFQVFGNLIGNAINYRNRDDGKVEILFEDLGDMYRFEVKDDGPGIDPRMHEKVFQIFERITDNKRREGTGIGLSIVKKIVEENDGEISLKSEIGKGASFSFTWPKRPTDS